MSDSAFQAMYRAEYIAAFERRDSRLRQLVTTETMTKGNQVYFLVAGSGGASAVTRGVNGYIPARSDDVNQIPITLAEWHDLVKKTQFNIFTSQGDMRALMQETTQAVINRKVDDLIIASLATATLTTGTTKTFSLNLAAYAKVVLANNNAGGSQVSFLISPAAYGYLMQIKEFASADYVDMKPFAASNDMIEAEFRWMNSNWVVHNALPGNGTANETLFAFNKRAVGAAINVAGIQTPVGFDEEQAYSWARASVDMGVANLQNSGIVKIPHDGSAFAPV